MGRTAGETITDALRFGLNKGSDTVHLDQDSRDRCHFFLTSLAQQAERHAPLWWKNFEGEVTVTLGVGNGVGTLPATFASFGKDGDVYVNDAKLAPLVYTPPDQLFELREREQSLATYPTRYTLHGKTALGLPKLYVHPFLAADVTLQLNNFVRATPTLYDAPIPPVATAGAAGTPNGTYRYRVTFVHADGETEGGAVSDAITVASKKVELSEIAICRSRGCTARKVYRTEDDGSVYKLLATISDNATTTYSDNIADGALGATCPTPEEAVTGLEHFPADFHESLFGEALIGRIRGSNGDPREGADLAAFAQQIRDLWATHAQGQNTPQAMPRYAGCVRPSAGRPLRSWRERFTQ